MPDKPSPDEPPMVAAAQWATRIMTLAIEMVVPGLFGVWADNRFGTKALFTLVGFALGGSVAFWQLLKLAGPAKRRPGDSSSIEKRERRGP